MFFCMLVFVDIIPIIILCEHAGDMNISIKYTKLCYCSVRFSKLHGDLSARIIPGRPKINAINTAAKLPYFIIVTTCFITSTNLQLQFIDMTIENFTCFIAPTPIFSPNDAATSRETDAIAFAASTPIFLAARSPKYIPTPDFANFEGFSPIVAIFVPDTVDINLNATPYIRCFIFVALVR